MVNVEYVFNNGLYFYSLANFNDHDWLNSNNLIIDIIQPFCFNIHQEQPVDVDCVCRLIVEWSDEAGGAGLSQSQRYRRSGHRSRGSSQKYTAGSGAAAAPAASIASDWAHIPVRLLIKFHVLTCTNVIYSPVSLLIDWVARGTR